MLDQRAWLRLGLALLAVAGIAAGACTFTVGRSVDQRDIVVQRFGSGPTPVLIIGGLHTGVEDNSRILAEQIATYLREQPQVVPANVTVYVVASANPDGTARKIRTNAHGVDLNRNWPSDNWTSTACHPQSGCRAGLGGVAPLSEPETHALYQLIVTLRPELTIAYHAAANVVEANEAGRAGDYGRLYAANAGYPYIEEWRAYTLTGQMIDAVEQRLGLAAMDVEMSRCCSVTPADFERNLRGVVAVLNEAALAPPPATATPRVRDTPTPRPSATPTWDLPDIDLP
jgi:predicted deacylase